ncbi:heavy metal translocating P-type ATPase [Halogeometricum pallidum JCM 14848]|uniref:Heavy metal translocating P-type ATPase n=1 Tax=Halogeometricum pallidum JCM 14848 TaxID=1227487 RepID=M0D7E8_HALPD|nr:heavy metal translocating P-type ATPase [Halogeometricum pallidum]ELZ31420.1 heavy metal translocating P-type ATPase [Halogeometricum pallidum JCM 14848]
MEQPEEIPPATCTLSIERRGGRGEAGAVAVARTLEATPGVYEADVSFRTGSVRISYDQSAITRDDLERLVRDHNVTVRDETEPDTDDVRTRADLRREAAFVVLTLAGMGIGLVTGWRNGPQLLLWAGYGVAYVFGGWYGLKGAVETLRHRAVDIDLLMIVAALGALSIGAPFEGAMLLFLFSLSNTLQHYAIGRSRRAIRSLVEMRPESAQVLRDGAEVALPIDEVEVGDVFVLRPGDRIPLDGVVRSGESAVDQASLTGESVPVTKTPGDEVFGGTINESGSLEVEVTRQAHESAIARLIHMVERAQSEKAPTQRLIDRLEQPYVLGVFGLTVAAIAVPLALGGEFASTFYRAMTLMVAASPCAVVISTPAAVLSAIASGGRQGVLFKGGEHVETAATVDAVAFDKTGTLTAGDTQLTDVAVDDRRDEVATEDELLALAAAVQARSEHHLAKATVAAAAERSLDVADATGFRAAAGKGVRATVGDARVHIGNRSYFETTLADAEIDGFERGVDRLASLEAEGKTSVLVARETNGVVRVLGWLAFTDTLRPGAAEMVAELRSLGVERVVMLTGDNEGVARRIADEVGVDEVQAELLPEEKVTTIEELVSRYGSVAMVGDGVNDAPALATATLGVAMGGAGTDVALETADVVLMGDDLGKIPYVLRLGRKTRRTLTVNLAIAFGAIALMVAAILLRGIPLPLAVVGHEGSTVLVSLNGLRLLSYR